MSMNLPWRNPSRIRTGVSGVADQHLTTRSWGHVVDGSSYRGGTWAGGTWGPAGQSPCCRAGGRPGPADRGRRSGRLLFASRGSPPVVGRRNGAGAGFAPASSTLQHRALSNRAATAWCLRPQSGWRGRLPPVARRARPPDRTENLPGFIRALYLLSLTDLVRRTISAPRLICLACRHASTVEISRHESDWRTSGSQGRQDSNQPPVLETSLSQLSYTPLWSCPGTKKPPIPGSRRAAFARLNASYPPHSVWLPSKYARPTMASAHEPSGTSRFGSEICHRLTVFSSTRGSTGPTKSKRCSTGQATPCQWLHRVRPQWTAGRAR